MNQHMRRAGMVLMGWMAGAGWLWGDQTALEPLPQNTQAVNAPVSANEGVSSLESLSEPTSTKGETKSIKISDGTSQNSSVQSSGAKSSKKSSKKKSKKSKTTKSKKKSKALSGIDTLSEIG
jgi:hypothetical protein